MFEAAERVADAVLYEGYVLYPYRASSMKNQLRWQFGVLAPRAPGEDGEPWFSQTECLVALAADARSEARLSIRVRFLRPGATPAGWLEGAPVSFDVGAVHLGTQPVERCYAVEGGRIDAVLLMHTATVDGFVKVRLRLENREKWHPAFERDRDAKLQRSLVAAHLLLAIEGGAFVSLLDPPAAAAEVACTCRNQHTWPVLVGSSGGPRLMLSSPIVLYDYPAVAPESRADLCDAAEIDEILSLRILTLTDDEKREARATDPRARAILDSVDALSPADFESLHGTLRSADFFNPAGASTPEEAIVVIDGQPIGRGAHVRLRPNRRADAMDIFFRDQRATVAGVYRDVDDRAYVAVTIDIDPAAAMHESFGRYFYFDPTEIEPLDREQEAV